MIAPTYITGADRQLLRRLVRRTLRGRVLDVGCGLAEAKRLLLAGSSYVGLDAKAGAGVDVVADAHAMPLPDGSFDGVLCASMLEHVRDERQVIAEMYRVLAPGGTIVVTLPFLLHYHQDPEDYRRLTRPGLAAELQQAGFTDVHTYANCGAFTVIEFVLFSVLVHARREGLFRRRWYLLPYYVWVVVWFLLLKAFNYVTAPLQRFDDSLYVGLAATAVKR